MTEVLRSDRIARYKLRVVPDAGELMARTQMNNGSMVRPDVSKVKSTV